MLLNHLTGLSVERFELASGGDPRSIAIKLTFSENEYFSNQTLEKKFWWRYAKDGWAGHVSEPVKIDWKSKDKDLTQGMLDLVCQVRDAEKKAGKKLDDDAEPKKSLLALMEETGLGGVSFFAWFGFCGRDVSAEQSVEAFKIEQDKRQRRKAGEDVQDDEEEDDDDFDEYETEIFPTADDVAVCIAEDVWPNAIKYFSMLPPIHVLKNKKKCINTNADFLVTAQEHDALSDMDFEESDEEMEEADGDEQPSKKRKA